MRVINLASGSKGNATLIETETQSILVDCGLSIREIEKRLKLVGCPCEKIKAILVSHIHSDHILGISAFSNKYDVPVFARSINWQNNIVKNSYRRYNNGLIGVDLNLRNFMDEEKFVLGDLEIEVFEVHHDAPNTVGFTFTNKKRKCGIVTDLGEFNATALNFLSGSDLVLIESNHDLGMLKNGNYPFVLKSRIASTSGHLSNSQTANAIFELYNRGTKFFMLMHLSQENNEPNLAISTIYNYLNDQSINSNSAYIFVSNQNIVSKNFILNAKIEGEHNDR